MLLRPRELKEKKTQFPLFRMSFKQKGTRFFIQASKASSFDFQPPSSLKKAKQKLHLQPFDLSALSAAVKKALFEEDQGKDRFHMNGQTQMKKTSTL